MINYLPYLLLVSLSSSERIIKNIDIPSCKTCKYFQPSPNDQTFASTLSKCSKFGTKNIFTDEITLDYAELSRNDENKCGFNGKYYEEEKRLKRKIWIHKLKTNKDNIIIISMLILYLVIIYLTNVK
jgi:hypothetical protein